MTSQELESNLAHVAHSSLTTIELWVKELAIEVKEDWPHLVHLVTSGDLGKKILNMLATLKPIIGFAEMMFPALKPIIDWVIKILTQIAELYPVATACTCPACAI